MIQFCTTTYTSRAKWWLYMTQDPVDITSMEERCHLCSQQPDQVTFKEREWRGLWALLCVPVACSPEQSHV